MFDLPRALRPNPRAELIEISLDLRRAAQIRLARHQSHAKLSREESEGERHVLAFAHEYVEDFERARAVAPPESRDQGENRGALRVGHQRGDVRGGHFARCAGVQA